MTSTRPMLLARAILPAALAAGLWAPPAARAFSGSEGATFLEIPVGGRPAALGSAYSALATDSQATAWNPAGLGFLTQAEASGMHLSYLEQMSYEALAAGIPVGASGGLGAALQYFRAGGQTATDVSGNPAGEFSGYYLSAALGFGRRFTPRLSAGAAARIITAQIAGAGASAFAADLGALAQVTPRLRVAMVVANWGSRLKFLQESDPLPAQLRLGAAAALTKTLTASVEGVRAFHSDDSLHLGGEWRPVAPLAVRLGYRTDITRQAGSLAGLTLGTGLSWQAYSFDYAWVPVGDLGSTQYFSLAVRFGAERGPDNMGGGSMIVLPAGGK